LQRFASGRREIRRDLGGLERRVRDGSQKEPFAEIEALGAGALAMLDLPASALWRLL